MSSEDDADNEFVSKCHLNEQIVDFAFQDYSWTNQACDSHPSRLSELGRLGK